LFHKWVWRMNQSLLLLQNPESWITCLGFENTSDFCIPTIYDGFVRSLKPKLKMTSNYVYEILSCPQVSVCKALMIFLNSTQLECTIQNIWNVDGTHFFPNWKIIWVTIWSWFVHGAKQEIKVWIGKLLYHFLNHAKWHNLPMIGDQWQTLIMSNELIAALVSTY
jgi:hypothetical protein